MATNFYPSTLVTISGPLSISDKGSADMPLDIRGRIETLTDITTIPFAWEGMLVYVRDTKKYYKVTSLANRTVAGVTIPYYPATWVEFGSGGSTPSPTPSEIDAGDVSYFSSGTFGNNTVGKELQSLANDILSLAEDIHNLSGDIGTLSNLDTENKQDLVAAINEVLASTGSTITVVNNLLSNSTTDALSAYQGKVLKGLIDGKVAGIKVQGETSILPMLDGVVELPAPPTIPITKIKLNGASSDLPINNGRVTIPDYANDIKEINNKFQQIGNPEPIVIPSSDTEILVLGDNFTYDPDTTYIMSLTSGSSTTQVATVHYPYAHDNINYVAFKAIDKDLIYLYSVDGLSYTWVGEKTISQLPIEGKAAFESGKTAVKQVIDVKHTGNPIPEGYFKHGTPNVFVTPDGYPLRYNQIKENNVWYILLKCDENNKIFKYFADNNGKWSLVTGGCYTKDDTTTGADYIKYDVYFDRQPASNISFDDSVAHLGTTLTPVDTVQKAINVIAVGVAGNIGKLIIKLLYPNSTPVTNKEVSITAYYRGNPFDLSPQYTPDFSGFKTDSNGYVVNADGGEFISLPLGTTYTIHYTDISDSYLTPEDTTGVVDSSEKTISNIYQNVSENEFVYFYVQMPNVSPSVVTPENKVISVDFYSNPTTHDLAYKCILRADGTVKQILNADGTQATYNGEDLISDSDPVLLPVSTGTKYLSSLQLWDTSLSENEQRYIKSSDVIYTASKAKRTVKFTYLDNQVGVFLIVADATTSKGYRTCLVTSIDTVNSKILFKDGDYTYEAYLSNSTLYKKLENDVAVEVWEETILGYGIKTSTTILNTNDDTATVSEYPNCSFIMPKNATTLKGALSSTDVDINIPINFGGLFVSNCYNELSGDTSSPLINRLLNNEEEAWSLTTSGGTKTIKAFAATLDQFNVIRGVFTQVSSINNILFGTAYTYAKTGVTTIHSITLVTNNGTQPTSTGREVACFSATTLNRSNPQAVRIASTSLNIIVLYPFS